MKKTTQAQKPMEVLAPEAPHEEQGLPAPEALQTQSLPPPKGPKMQDVAAKEEEGHAAEDEASGSSASGSWHEPEDPHPPEKRIRRSSPDYDPAEELPKIYECRHKRIHRVVRKTSVSAAAHSAQPESQPTMGPSESEPEPQAKKGSRNKMPI